MPLLQRGLRGEPVRLLQEKLGVTADGIFGAGTDKALRDYQSANGLAVDGRQTIQNPKCPQRWLIPHQRKTKSAYPLRLLNYKTKQKAKAASGDRLRACLINRLATYIRTIK